MSSPDRPSTPAASHRLRTLAVAAGGTTALLLAAAVPAADAATVKTTGTTTIKLSTSLKSTLKRSGTSLSGLSPARRGATAVKLPLSSATIDPETQGGTINHSGSLRFRRAKRSIVMKGFRVTIDPESSSIAASIGGSRVRVFDVDLSGIAVKQSRRRLTLSNLGVKLTAIGASRLNRALRTTRYKSGASFGVASTAIDVPANAGGSTTTTSGSGSVLKGGTSTLTLTEEAKAGLAASGASVSTIAPATGSGNGPFAFPVTGGGLDGGKGFAGQALLGGALVLSAQGGSITLQDPIVDVAAKQVTAIVNGSRVEAFSLDTSGLQSVRYEGQLVLDGILVKRATSGPLSDPSGQPSGVIGFLRLDATTD
jgi:hypothetical protein